MVDCRDEKEPVGRIPLIGESFPEVEVKTTFGSMVLPKDYAGKWFVLFSHPADFTPICTSEFVGFAMKAEKFRAEETELIGLSIDQIFSHLKWVEWIEERMGVTIPFPVIADGTGVLASKLGMIHPARATNTVRSVFIVDPLGKIRLMIYYPPEVGRSIDEILRAVKALRYSDAHNVSTPENWPNNDLMPGEVVLPAPRDYKSAMERKRTMGKECYDWWFCHKKM
jgi:peroxiredoxin (alkyl hydroperoxide reductase subunit C)